jgi:hypothetical protein
METCVRQEVQQSIEDLGHRLQHAGIRVDHHKAEAVRG